MSTDTRQPAASASISASASDAVAAWREAIPWETVLPTIRQHRDEWNAREIFGPEGRSGAVYRWGIGVASGAPCEDAIEVLSRLACGVKPSKKLHRLVDLNQWLSDWNRSIPEARELCPLDAATAVLVAASLPALLEDLPMQDWQGLLGRLMEIRNSIEQRNDPSSPLQLILVAELGLTLALLFPNLAPCAKLQKPSAQALGEWCRLEAESVSAALASPLDTRLVLASLIRSKRLISAGGVEPSNKKSWKSAGRALATWVAAMTTHGGSSAMSPVGSAASRDDWGVDGLLDQATHFEPESLKPAIAAALGQAPKGGRLTWEVSLPESLHHDPRAKLAVMFPQWDIGRGRMHIDYGSNEVRIEVFGGRKRLVSGTWDTLIELDGQPQQSNGQWEEICEFSDDDVHYLELEQPWSGDLILQRQVLLLREDRCVLLADAVLPAAEPTSPVAPAESELKPDSETKRKIRFTSRLPLGLEVKAEPDDETREIVLSIGTKKAMLLPLAANEWRFGPTSSTLTATDDGHLAISVQGQRRLYVPLWIDLQPRRFKRNRTWRQLTIADQLRIVDRDEAAGYRIQMGSEQWMVYRSFGNQTSRSVLGKHLMADFFCSRFDLGDGSHEELISVDESESDDDE